MDKMIERIASILRELDGENRDWQYYVDDAFGIVRDMREPTLQMLRAGAEKKGADAWTAMIDAILSESFSIDSKSY